MTCTPWPFRLVRYLRLWSRSDDLSLDFSSVVTYTVLLSEKVRDEEGDCVFFDFLFLWRGEVVHVFFLLRRLGPLRAIELSSDAFDDDSVSDGSGSISL